MREHPYAEALNIRATAALMLGLRPSRAAARPAIGDEKRTPPASKMTPRMGECGGVAAEDRLLMLLE